MSNTGPDPATIPPWPNDQNFARWIELLHVLASNPEAGSANPVDDITLRSWAHLFGLWFLHRHGPQNPPVLGDVEAAGRRFCRCFVDGEVVWLALGDGHRMTFTACADRPFNGPALGTYFAEDDPRFKGKPRLTLSLEEFARWWRQECPDALRFRYTEEPAGEAGQHFLELCKWVGAFRGGDYQQEIDALAYDVPRYSLDSLALQQEFARRSGLSLLGHGDMIALNRVKGHVLARPRLCEIADRAGLTASESGTPTPPKTSSLVLGKVAVTMFHVTNTTLGRYRKAKKIKGYRMKDASSNAAYSYDTDELGRFFKRRDA